MLISMAIENFKSFDKLTNFNMIASNRLRGHHEKIQHEKGISILKSAVIYGANASGKSNFIEAFQFMRYCVLSSKGISYKHKSLFCKNKKDNENRITTFEIRMCINGICYAYGFDILLKNRTVEGEWIIELTENNKERILFKREHNIFTLGESLHLSETEKTRFDFYFEDMSEHTSVLFLSEMNRNKKIDDTSALSFFKDIFHWFYDDLNVFSSGTPVTDFEYYYDEASLKIVEDMIRTFDTGITGIQIRELTPDELKSKMPKEIFDNIIEDLKERRDNNDVKDCMLSLRFRNDFYNISFDENEEPMITTLCFEHGSSYFMFDFSEESDGTRRIFDLLDILLSKNKHSVYIIDEMERSLHPSLTKHFVELLNKYHKKSTVQLIFTTHEATIMTQELFRRDQIWFIARDKDNHSNLYPLDSFNVRYDKKISRDYLDGRYGAIPIFHDIDFER